MTEKTLSQRLPVGDPRNKVEFLADEFEATAAELLRRLTLLEGASSGSDVDPHAFSNNLLRNAGFVGAIDAAVNGGSDRWNQPYGTKDNNDSLSITGQVALQTSPNWGGEVPIGGSGTFRYDHWSFNTTEGALRYNAFNYKQVLFQVFRVPAVSRDALQTTSCYLRLMSGGGTERTRFGIVKLDENFKATGYVASKIAHGQGTHQEFDVWLNDIDLASTGCTHFAFFVERLDVKTYNMSSYILGAGVYCGGEPDFIPEIANTHIDFDDQQFIKIATGVNAADIKDNASFPLPAMLYPNGASKHLLVHVVEQGIPRNNFPSLITMTQQGDQFVLSGVSPAADTSIKYDIEAYYTKSVNKIHYYDMPDYVAA
ncbi:hypothetical protein C9J48_24005 [Photobacterium profundum]|uniref:Uncharacterized protein n=1 Tax=Photobacterium profundum 3TCK TaxID=314280 RepID=Q1Z9F3_9GAMM|nr:hypothetical protein [Photobacterium profundum]EAS44805.1 hypothetical protein P3TCK_20015 [Photobacterium profundum 3TCK]PSV59324.1 hypothetical protein C9J48_24005 [Photobacterium profundum]